MSRVARRHYRVAQKEIEQNMDRDMIIPKKRRGIFALIVVAIGIIAFADGMILGLLLGKSKA